MLSIKGIYDGKKIIPLEKLDVDKQYKVVITFIEALDDDEDIRDFSEQTDGVSFWHDCREDIYQDYLPGNRNKQ